MIRRQVRGQRLSPFNQGDAPTLNKLIKLRAQQLKRLSAKGLLRMRIILNPVEIEMIKGQTSGMIFIEHRERRAIDDLPDPQSLADPLHQRGLARSQRPEQRDDQIV